MDRAITVSNDGIVDLVTEADFLDVVDIGVSEQK